MVIASIDIQNGKVVQLKQGEELVLERDNPLEIIEEFDRHGEVALIDLDAAMGRGSNRELLASLLRKAQCRVGGGIKTPEQARELVSLGASKLILGSALFRPSGKAGGGSGSPGSGSPGSGSPGSGSPGSGSPGSAGSGTGEFGINTDFLERMAESIGRERIIAAVDARNGEIVVDGWKTPTGLPLIETAKALDGRVSEFLFTCVEREGTMTGIALEQVRELRAAVSCPVTVAGGVSSLEEVELLAKLGCDVQLGMALYTGKISLAEAFAASLAWEKAGPAPEAPAGTMGTELRGTEPGSSPGASQRKLLPLIAQAADGQVLMTGFTDREALLESFKRGNLCFHSRSRNKLWMKGESSGNTLKLIRLRADCDRDALLAVVVPAGPSCHTGSWTCFETGRNYTWDYLQAIITERFRNPRPGSYTATLDDELVREKLMEEAEELCSADSHENAVWEAADLLYFMTVLMTRRGVTVQEVLDELDRRHKK